LWTRGILKHEFGVEDTDMEHWMDRQPGRSHRGEVGFSPRAGLKVHQVGPETNIGRMMEEGKLDAVMSYNAARPDNAIDRSTADLANDPKFRPLFDKATEGPRYFKKTGIYPINHGMVIKREILEKHPWVALNIYKAFEKANAIAEAERRAAVDYHLETGLLPPEARKGLAAQVLHHGIHQNRKVLETAAQYSHEQGLTPRVMKLEELFAASTMEQ
jgi:4,5-dihydroxyphthalate decarboxylase